jgi:hypothetical protein
MTISRRGSRPVVVEGHPLRFSVFRKGIRGCPDCDRRHVIIVGESRRGSTVQIGVDDDSGPDLPITPRMIAEAARRALALGWQPGEGTGVFLGVPARELSGVTSATPAPSAVAASTPASG